MAVYDLEEQEKIDALKDWWKRWGTTVMAALAAFVVAYVGFSQWRSYQTKRSQEAAVLYEALKQQKSASALSANAKAIMEQHGKTAYAPRAALSAAKASFEAGDLDAARTFLEWVIAHAKEKELQEIARLRLATVLLDENKLDAALQVLQGNHEQSFQAAALSLKADILAAQGKISEARAVYREALDKADPATDRQPIEIKLEMLGEGK